MGKFDKLKKGSTLEIRAAKVLGLDNRLFVLTQGVRTWIRKGVGPDGEAVAYMDNTHVDQNRNDAAEIVHRYNAHDDLLVVEGVVNALIEKTKGQIERLGGSKEPWGYGLSEDQKAHLEDLEDLLETAEEALEAEE